MTPKTRSTDALAPVLYIPHGGGPLPLLGDRRHEHMVDFLRKITGDFAAPAAILVVSAHWEEEQPTITGAPHPEMIYDYYGFPPESYELQYPAPGEPNLAKEILDLIEAGGIRAKLDERRGFDHGLFVPLMLMYPDARIPCLQLSLLKNLNAAAHIALGKTLTGLRRRNVLVVGSGMSFHNLREFFSSGPDSDSACEQFDAWLRETCAGDQIVPAERERRLIEWETAPAARFCHPREEHLLPLHVCYGVANADTPAANVAFNDSVMGKRVTGLLWQ